MSQPLNAHQFRQSLKSLVGQEPASGWDDGTDDNAMLADYQALVSDGLLVCPVDVYQTSVIPERIALFTDANRKGRSTLVQILLDRGDEAILAVDSFLTGKDALHLVALVETPSDVETWLQAMNRSRMAITIKPINETQKLMIAPLSSFVPAGDSC